MKNQRAIPPHPGPLPREREKQSGALKILAAFVTIAAVFMSGCVSPEYRARCTGCGEEITSSRLVRDEFQPIQGGWIEVKTAAFKCRKCKRTFLRPYNPGAIHQDLGASGP